MAQARQTMARRETGQLDILEIAMNQSLDTDQAYVGTNIGGVPLAYMAVLCV